MRAFEVERLGHDADGQDALLAGRARDHRSGAGARATAHAGGDEDHVGAFKVAHDLGELFLGGGAADIGTRPGAQTARDRRAELKALFGQRAFQRLGVRIGDDELDAFQVGLDHVVDGVAARATDTEHRDVRPQIHFDFRHAEIDHDSLQFP